MEHLREHNIEVWSLTLTLTINMKFAQNLSPQNGQDQMILCNDLSEIS